VGSSGSYLVGCLATVALQKLKKPIHIKKEKSLKSPSINDRQHLLLLHAKRH
jgi:hypothetical protein